MKSRENRFKKLLMIASVACLAGTLVLISSCSKDDVVEPFGFNVSTGNDVLDIAPDAEWSMDKTHSNIGWETFYYGDNALLTGRFNKFNMNMHFDQANPGNTTIDAWVQLSTFNTGEPGRDGAGKCGPGYMGVEWDVDTIPEPDVYTPIATSDTAWFTSTNTERFGSGYVSHGTFDFRGIQIETDLYFQYQGINYTISSGDTTATRSGFLGQFEMNAISDFGVPSGSISDLVTVNVNFNARKN